MDLKYYIINEFSAVVIQNQNQLKFFYLYKF